MRTDYRETISLISPPSGVNEYGETSGEWATTYSNIFASKEQLLGNELQTALGTDSKIECKFRTYWFDGITSDMRVRCSDGDYIILSAVNVKSLNREWLLYCRKARNGE